MPSQPRRRSNGELAERVKSILASKNLTLYQVSERSAELFGRSSPQYLPHNLYYDLRHGSFSPSLFQLFAFSRISGYRLVDWLRVFGFDVEAIPRLQIQLSSKRTTLLDSSVEDPHTRVAWLRNLAARAPSEDVVPLSQVLEWTAPRTLASLAAIRDKGFLYAKIGYQDAWSFPELLPGSIVRVRPISMDDLLQRPRGEQSKGLILIEHARGLCCCRIRIVGAQRIAMVATQMPYAQVEFNVPQEARIIGAADLEIRNLLRPEPPAVPKEFAKRWRPEVLSEVPIPAWSTPSPSPAANGTFVSSGVSNQSRDRQSAGRPPLFHGSPGRCPTMKVATFRRATSTRSSHSAWCIRSISRPSSRL